MSFIALIAFYFVLMRLLAGSWDAAIYQFEKLWYYMIPLSLGFGTQIGLYGYLKGLIKNNTGKHVMIANSSASAIGMVACCVHHLADVIPIIGLSLLSNFLITFQTPILLIGIISNSLGVYYLVQKIKIAGKNIN